MIAPGVSGVPVSRWHPSCGYRRRGLDDHAVNWVSKAQTGSLIQWFSALCILHPTNHSIKEPGLTKTLLWHHTWGRSQLISPPAATQGDIGTGQECYCSARLSNLSLTWVERSQPFEIGTGMTCASPHWTGSQGEGERGSGQPHVPTYTSVSSKWNANDEL